MGLVTFWIAAGIAAGLWSKPIFPGVAYGALVGNQTLGLLGAVAGGWLASYAMGESNSAWAASALGACVGSLGLLAVIYQWLTKPDPVTK